MILRPQPTQPINHHKKAAPQRAARGLGAYNIDLDALNSIFGGSPFLEFPEGDILAPPTNLEPTPPLELTAEQKAAIAAQIAADKLAMENAELNHDRNRVGQFLDDASLYISDYEAYGRKYPQRTNVADAESYLSHVRANNFVGLIESAEENLSFVKTTPSYVLLWHGGPLADTAAGRDLFAATLLNLKPIKSSVTNTTELRAFEAYKTFSIGADRSKWLELSGEVFPNPTYGMAAFRPQANTAYWSMGAGRLTHQKDFWDTEGMFYPFAVDAGQETLNVWRRVMGMFYGNLPSPYMVNSPVYNEFYTANNGRIAYAEYGNDLANIFRQLPVDVKNKIVAYKPPFYVAGEKQKNNFFQSQSGRNLENAIIYSQWIIGGADPDNLPVYKKQQTPPSRSDEIKQVAIGFAGFIMAFIGVPPIVGAISVVVDKALENYVIELADDAEKDLIKAEAAQVAAEKEAAEIEKQTAKIQAELDQLKSGRPVSVIKNNRTALTFLAVGAAILMAVI